MYVCMYVHVVVEHTRRSVPGPADKAEAHHVGGGEDALYR